jgi:hypothetical protein|nr:hypothetical protein Q903MT_gene1269 [Picea sitchensis]
MLWRNLPLLTFASAPRYLLWMLHEPPLKPVNPSALRKLPLPHKTMAQAY